MSKLNVKQELFVKEYLVDKNATQAAIRAGYSEKTASVIGAENLTKPNIAEAIQSELDKTHKKLDISVEKIQQELASMAFGEVSSTSILNNRDKTKALELLGKNKAMFTDKIEGKLTGDLAVSITVKGHKV